MSWEESRRKSWRNQQNRHAENWKGRRNDYLKKGRLCVYFDTRILFYNLNAYEHGGHDSYTSSIKYKQKDKYLIHKYLYWQIILLITNFIKTI